MKMGMLRPCAKCPFRTDVKPYIRPERAAQIGRALLRDQSFACHETVRYDDNGTGHVGPNAQHCAGAMILLEHIGRPNQWMRIMERIKQYNRFKLDMSAPVFRTMQDWIAHIRWHA